jgi:hypothetical protein
MTLTKDDEVDWQAVRETIQKVREETTLPWETMVGHSLNRRINMLASRIIALETRIAALEKRLDERKDLDEKPNDGTRMPQKSE